MNVKLGAVSRRRRLATGAAVAVLSMAIAACGIGSGGEPESGTIRLALSSAMSTSWAQIAVASEEGFFEDEDLDVKVQLPGGSGDVLQSMAVGRTEIGAPTPEAVFAAVDGGQEVTMTYEWTRGSVQSLAVEKDSDIDDFSDLEGKKIGVASLSSGAKTLAEASLELSGLDPSSQAEFLAVGSGASAWDALRRDRVDALMLWDTEYALMKYKGANLKFILPEEMSNLFSTTLVARNDWLRENKDAMAGFGRAWAKATVWATANPEAAVRDVWKMFPETKTSSDEETLMRQHIDIFKSRNEVALRGNPGGTNSWGKYDPSAVEHWSEFAKKFGITDDAVPPDSIYTNEFVEEYNKFDASKIEKLAEKAK